MSENYAYDDSLSYYELLSKVVNYLNNMMNDLNLATGTVEEFAEQFVTNQEFLNNMARELGENTQALEDYINERMQDFIVAYNDLQDYVNDYFNNLDVQEEINNKLDVMASDGSLDTLFMPYVEDWLTEQGQAVANQNSRISVLEGRMDTFASLPSGSTSGNAELLDIRTNFLGETFDTAGDAVRVSDLVASGYISLPLIETTSGSSFREWFDVEKYKGGKIAIIINTAPNDPVTYSPMRTGNTTAYSESIALNSTDLEDFNYVILRNYNDENYNFPCRMLITFTVPSDFEYKYIGVEGWNGITGEILPKCIVYGTYWDKTPVDPTLSVSGEAADAKVTGDSLSELNERFGQLTLTPYTNLFESDLVGWNEGYVNENGTIMSASSLQYSNEFDISGFSQVRKSMIYNSVEQNVVGCFYDDTHTFISGIDSSSIISIPDNAVYVRINRIKNKNARAVNKNYFYILKTGIDERFVNIENTIEQVPKTPYVNLYETNLVSWTGGYIGDNGEIGYTPLLEYSDYIDCDGFKALHKSFMYNGNEQPACGGFYDIDKTFITKIDARNIVPIPNNARYIRLNRLSSLDTRHNNSNYAYLTLSSKWIGKTISVLGDSITYGFGLSDRTNEVWTSVLAKRTGATVNNYGLNSSKVSKIQDDDVQSFVDRRNLVQESDLIIIFGGTNDYWHTETRVGSDTSYDVSTFCGALNYLFNYYQTEFPSKKLLYIFPMHQYYSGEPDSHDFGYGPFNAFRAGAIGACANSGVPMLDLYANSGTNVALNATQRSYYTQDGVHPNAVGHKMIADIIYNYIENILG